MSDGEPPQPDRWPTLLPVRAYAEAIGDATTVLRTNAASAGLDVPVPTTPGWTVADLVAHVGVVHRWAHAALAARAPQSPPSENLWAGLRKDVPPSPHLLDWFDEGSVDLLKELARFPDDGEAWFFLRDAPPARWAWARR